MRIIESWTFLGLLFGSPYTTLWIVLLFLTAAFHSRQLTTAFFAATGIVMVWAAIIVVVAQRRIARRDKAIAVFAAQHAYRLDAVNMSGYIKELGSVSQLENAHNPKIKNVVVGPDWAYCDFSFAYYQRTKTSSYKAQTIYYGVMTTKLPRRVPHIFFDSVKARRRQFRFHFARGQKHGLEGDFDKHFVTYFPQGYHVDSLSIISPDVMLALLGAQHYDIEIVDDRLFLFGPLSEPDKQLPDMAAHITKIKKELLENIDTYRDERLPGQQGRYGVSAQGSWLQRSRFWKIVGTILTILSFLLAFYLQILDDRL